MKQAAEIQEMIPDPVLMPVGRVEEEMTIMAEIGRLISSSLKIEEVFDRFAEEARKLIPIDGISVNLINPDGMTLTIAYMSGVDIENRRPGDAVCIAGTISGAVIESGKGILVQPEDQLDLDCGYPINVTYQCGMHSLICVPLISKDIVFGTLQFQARTKQAYTEKDLRLAERVGSQIAGAIANVQIFASFVKTEMTLRENEARFRAIFEQAAAGVAEMEFATGRFLTVNRRLCQITGYTEEEMRAMTFQSITHPEDIDVHKQGMKLLLDGAVQDFTIEKRYLRKGGKPVWVSITISALWKKGEIPRNYLAIVQDIDEHKRAETALMQSEIRYRTLFESAGDHIFILRPDAEKRMVIVDANRAAIEKYGYSREELIGKSLVDLSTPAYRKQKSDMVRLLNKPGETLLLEAEHVGKGGQTFPVEVSARRIQIDPEPPFILAIERDITDRMRIGRELSKSKEASERLTQEMAIITKIGRKISSTLHIDEVYERLAAESGELISYDRLLVALLDSREATFTVVYFSGVVVPERNVSKSFPVAGSIGEVVLNRRAGIVIQAANKEEILRICPYVGVVSIMQLGILSLMSVPLISNDKVIGALHFRSKKPNAYTEQDLRLAEGIGREIAGAIANARLYTDLQRTEKSLREGKELYSRLIDAVPDGVTQTDSDGKILFANEVALKLGGFADVRDVQGRDILTFVAPEDRSRAEENFRQRTGNVSNPQTYRLVADDGRSITAEVNAKMLYNEDGTPYGSVLLFRDVTERNRMEEALRASEANYRFLNDNMNDLIWTTDLNLCTTYINRSVQKILGYSPEERIGKDLSTKCSPESFERIGRIIAEQREIEMNGSVPPNRFVTIETEYYHKDGSTVWMESVVSGLRDKTGALIGYHGVSRNIMERKKLEQELGELLGNLEKRIHERTIELEEVNTALRVLLKKGEQDLKKLGRDIKNNIDRLVMPFLQRLRTSPSIEQNRIYANIIESNLTHITSPFIDQLSEAYKNLTPKEIQVAAMIRDGRSSKEIAEIIGVSIGTVVTHRNNIRKKLKLSSRSINLRSRLLSFS